MRSKNYSYFLTRVAGLMGMSSADLQTDEKANLNGFFNRAIRDGWERTNWVDLCPYGEARFVGNSLTNPGGYSEYVTVNGLVATENQKANPLDARVTAAKLAEGTGLNFFRIAGQAPALHLTDYSWSIYVRPNGRNFCRMSVGGADPVPYAYFSLTGQGAVVSSTDTTATITQAANGFYLVSVTYTTDASSNTTTLSFDISADGITNIYTGNGSSGLFIWGWWVGPATNAPLNAVLPWEQENEQPIESLFNAWQSQPTNLRLPVQARYSFVPDGIQFYSNAGTQWYPWTPSLQNMSQTVFPAVVFIYYRKQCPDFVGDDFDAAAEYAVDDQVYFTDSDDVGNYWKCVVATSAGEDPEDTPASWELLEIPDFLFDFIVQKSYSDWLLVEGQHAKAIANSAMAEELINHEFDKMERQQGNVMQTKISTHLSTQPN